MLVSILTFLLLLSIPSSFPKNFSSYTSHLSKRHDTKVYDIIISKETLAPDGFTREMYTINGQFPGPLIEVNKGDTLVLNVYNDLEDETSIHSHGMFQRGTPWYDGVPGQTQRGIPSKKSFAYEFKVNQSGTYWYHSHSNAQYIEGIVGPLIAYDPDDPYLEDYDDEIIVLLQDWYHNDSNPLLAAFMNPANVDGDEPTPDNGLINGKNSYNCSWAPAGSKCVSDAPLALFKFVQGKRYRIRIINTSAFAEFIFSIDEHPMDVIEVEGMITKRHTIHRLPINIAQRYSVIVTANQTIGKYWMRSEMETACLAAQSDHLNPLVKAIVEYEGYDNDGDPKSVAWAETPENCVDLDSSNLKPYNEQNIPDVDYKLIINVTFHPDDNGIVRGYINNSTYILDAKHPTLHKVFNNVNEYPADQNVYIIEKNKVVDIILSNNDDGIHPFHLHGHVFWVLGIGQNGTSPDYKFLNTKDPIQRDTVTVPPQGWAILRFVSDNPGVWGFHCHIEWHVQSGLVMEFVTQPDKIRELKAPYEWEQL
ncbi:Multicopper oxidase [Gigaspora rosea]|uniref:Multicopper oxidase n=1 Tax=Gigaspora rosea TaxID=44941 RepID=A0A397UCA1_9GLOM|nr:Multicopper oxidase [Gigaspora rosea]